jgi:YtcA-like protein
VQLSLTASVGALGSFNALADCARAPSFNIVGSFFPAWLICIVAGIGLAVLTNWVLRHYKLDQQIVWTIIVYPCLAAFFAFTLWLIFFS